MAHPKVDAVAQALDQEQVAKIRDDRNGARILPMKESLFNRDRGQNIRKIKGPYGMLPHGFCVVVIHRSVLVFEGTRLATGLGAGGKTLLTQGEDQPTCLALRGTR